MTDDRTLPTLENISTIVHACHARLGAPLQSDDLEDVVQETAIVLATNPEKVGLARSSEAWTYGVARNLIRNEVRRRSRRDSVERLGDLALDDVSPGSDDATRTCDTEMRLLIRRTVREHGTTAVRIVTAHHEDEHTFVRIARDLGLPPSTVKAKYARLLPLLRRRVRSMLTRFAA